MNWLSFVNVINCWWRKMSKNPRTLQPYHVLDLQTFCLLMEHRSGSFRSYMKQTETWCAENITACNIQSGWRIVWAAFTASRPLCSLWAPQWDEITVKCTKSLVAMRAAQWERALCPLLAHSAAALQVEMWSDLRGPRFWKQPNTWKYLVL